MSKNQSVNACTTGPSTNTGSPRSLAIGSGDKEAELTIVVTGVTDAPTRRRTVANSITTLTESTDSSMATSVESRSAGEQTTNLFLDKMTYKKLKFNS